MPQKTNRNIRILLSAVLLLGLFSLGVAVGRNNIHVPKLSQATLNAKNNSQLDYTSVDQLYSILKSNFDGNINTSSLSDGLKAGLVSSAGDPYTAYFNPKDAAALNETLSGKFTGIGAELGTDNTGNIVIVSPLKGLPADKAGIKAKDQIVAVDGQSTSGMSVDSVVKKIRGQANTNVKLTLVRNSGNPFEITITRQEIKVPSVESKVEGNIGYIKINQFTDDTVDLARQAAQEFKDKGVKGVVLDLRGNPGGYLNGAIDISSMWLDKGKVVVMEKKNKQVINTDYSTGSNPLFGIPTVVLIDGGSASASEITAGALHDNGAATLVGAKSFGKGSVQQVIQLGNGSELKVTVAHWYTPNDKNIDKQGITPDVVVQYDENYAKSGGDNQKDKAFQILQQKIGQ